MTHAHHRPHLALLADPTSGTRFALIDAHVHLHRHFNLAAVFDHAAANVARAAAALRLPADSFGVLMLTESVGVDRFGELMRCAEQTAETIGPWRVQVCDENESLRLSRSTQHMLIVIAGRQIVTRERLEVLALGTRRRIDDGAPIDETVHEVRRAGALPVIPWGFGKWTGRRARVMRRLIDGPLNEGLFLGDNGGRPRSAPTPPLFRQAGDRGVRLLPGTDPLPFAHQQVRAGRYGFMLPLQGDERRPFQIIHDLLLAQPGQPPIFGERDGWWAFAAAQVAMQWHNRTRRPRR